MQKYLGKFAAVIARNKKIFVFALPLIVLFSVFPPAPAEAFWPLIIIGGLALATIFDIPGISDVVSAAATPLLEALLNFVNIFAGIIAALLQGIYVGMGNLMHALIAYLIAIPVTPGSGAVGFVQEAWEFSILFVNMLLLLILVLIGLATILRLQSYQLQRTLPLLIMVALLVNFSGVLVGFVVDISNIIANFFLQAAANAPWGLDPWLGAAPVAEKLGQNIARILYYPLGILIYFIVMLLFGVRVVILWTLTILAPLAFAALILPATKSYWTQWWSNLIQWSIIGIPISFFLFLSGSALNAKLPPAEGGVATIAFIFAPLVALLLLFIGITISMQMAPAAAKGTVDFGKKWGLRGGMAAASAGWRFRGVGPVKMKKSLGENIQGWGEGMRKRADITSMGPAKRATIEKSIDDKTKERGNLGSTPEDMEKLSQLDKEIKDLEKEKEVFKPRGGLGKILDTRGVNLLTRWAGSSLEIGAGEANMRFGAKDKREIGEGKSEGLNQRAGDNILKINTEFAKGNFANMNRVVGLLNAMVANGDSNDIQEALRNGVFSAKEVGKALLASQRGGSDSYRPIAKALYGRLLSDPETLGPEFAVKKQEVDGTITIQRDSDGTPQFRSKEVGKIVKELPEKLTKADIASKFLGDTIDKGKTEGEEFMKFGGELVIKQLIDIRGGDLADTLVRRPESRVGRAEMLRILRSINPVELHEKGADGLITYLSSNAAQGAGVVSPLMPDEAQDLLQLLRDKDRLKTLAPADETKLQRLIRLWRGTPPTPPPYDDHPYGDGQPISPQPPPSGPTPPPPPPPPPPPGSTPPPPPPGPASPPQAQPPSSAPTSASTPSSPAGAPPVISPEARTIAELPEEEFQRRLAEGSFTREDAFELARFWPSRSDSLGDRMYKRYHDISMMLLKNRINP